MTEATPLDTASAQRLRMRRFLMSAASYMGGVLFIAVGVAASIFTPDFLISFALLSLTINAVFYAVFRSGINLRAADPSLTAAQMLAGIVAALLANYHGGALRGFMLS